MAEKNDYAKRYQKARNVATQKLIAAHQGEFDGYLTDSKRAHGIADQAQRRLDSKKSKAQAMLAELAEQGVDVSTLV